MRKEEQAIKLVQISDTTYEIQNAAQEKVGQISLDLGKDEVTICFEIIMEQRGRGYASEAVGQLTKHAHEELGIKNLHAYVEREQDMAIHVLEHHGYERIELQDGRLLYDHHREVTLSDDAYAAPEGCQVLYLAGGCFWGMERAFRELKGILETVVGYANGTLEHPTYEDVCQNETGYREAIRVTYDPKALSLEKLLKAYFICIDPTQADGQGGDIGTQYQTGVYYRDASLLPGLNAYLEEERKKYQAFYVECKLLENFWLAEEYHQDYLTKIPDGYCHIASREIEKIRKLNQSSESDETMLLEDDCSKRKSQEDETA